MGGKAAAPEVSAVSPERLRRLAASPLALGALSGALAGACFRWAVAAPLVFITWVPVIAAARRSARAAALAGALTGVIGYTIVFAWLPWTIERFQVTPLPYAWIFFAAGVAYHAPQVVLFALGVSAIAGRSGRPCAPRDRLEDALMIALEVAALWTLLEWSYPKVFPWSLGGALAPDRFFRQAADLEGVYGLGFAIIVVNTVLAVAIDAPPNSIIRRRGPAAALMVIGALATYGAWRTESSRDDGAAPGRVRVAVVQGALAPEQPYGEMAALGAWDTYERLTNRLFASSTRGDGGPPDVIVWPESTLPVYLRGDQWYRERIKQLVTRTGRPLIVGALDRGNDQPADFNSAYAFLPWGAGNASVGSNDLQIYHKSYLLPWAEYVPGGQWLPFLRWWRTTGELVAGTDRDSFAVELLPHGSLPLRIAPSICFEALQAGWFNRLVAGGASLLLNITDDGWFADTAAPELHLRLAQMRAVETRRWLVRASNSGISAFIDPTGQIVASLPFGEAGTLTHTVVPSNRLTPYVRFGDWVVWLSMVIVAITVARRLRLARESGVRLVPGEAKPSAPSWP